MKISIISPSELDATLRSRWLGILEGQPLLGSPYFAPEFVAAAGAARRDVRVAVIEAEGRVAGFFPFQQAWGAGRPVGGRLSDHHGVIAEAGFEWDWAGLLDACKLGYWQFDHLPAWQRPLWHGGQSLSRGLDLSAGFDAYVQRRLGQGARRLGELPRKARKLAREVGPVRLEEHSADGNVLQTVIALKSAQCRRTGADDCFAQPWARDLVERIRAVDEPHFGGRLSALYAGDTLVAAHFGMRSRRVWHWWFPVYEQRFAAYSPGALLLHELARTAAAQGHELVDLGKGEEAYKSSFADTGTALVEGVVARPSPITSLRVLRKSTGRWLRSSVVAAPVRPVLRYFGRLAAALLCLPGLATLALDMA
jgi:CelD/BcsL family acetyltransferase involved in cellulose biosynthesis